MHTHTGEYKHTGACTHKHLHTSIYVQLLYSEMNQLAVEILHSILMFAVIAQVMGKKLAKHAWIRKPPSNLWEKCANCSVLMLTL